MTMTWQFVDMTSWLNFFDVVLFRLSNLVTGPSFMAISSLVLELWQFFYKELTRNPEIRNTPVWRLPNIWVFRRVRDTKFGTNVSNKISRNAAKCQDYSFYRFWVIKGKLTRGGGGENYRPPTTTQIRFKREHKRCNWFWGEKKFTVNKRRTKTTLRRKINVPIEIPVVFHCDYD